MEMEDVWLVKAWNCVVVLNFDPQHLIGLMFDYLLIPMLSQPANDPVRIRVDCPLIVAVVVPPYLVDLVAIAPIDWLATMDFEPITFDSMVAVAETDTTFEMTLNCCYSQVRHYCRSLGSYLAFDFSHDYHRRHCQRKYYCS